MKSTPEFKETLKAYLDDMASKDTDFKAKYQSKDKTLDNCVTYVLNTVKKSGCNGFADDEIYGMATHYYDEPKIDIGKPIKGQVVVNHSVENDSYKVYKITAQEVKDIKEYIKELTDVSLKKPLQDDLEQLRAKPLDYWKGLDLESYKTENPERYEEVKFMIDHYTKKVVTVKSRKPKTTKPKVTKPKATTSAFKTPPPPPPPKVDKKGQTALF